MKGCTTNGGYVAFIGEPQVADCSVNDVLEEAGCVFYARTTQPQVRIFRTLVTNRRIGV